MQAAPGEHAVVAVGTPTTVLSGTDGSNSTPRGLRDPSTPEEFTALRRHVEFKEMDMGELLHSHGLSSALAAMEKAEINPIVQHGDMTARHSFS